jgi:hypothetical protein
MSGSLQDLEAFIDARGSALEGLDPNLSEETAAALVAERYGDKPFCLVSHWSLLTVKDVPTPLLYAEYVIYDSLGRFRSGDWVRSSPAIASREKGMFETRNTVYVLLGPGRAKTASAGLVLGLH